MASLKQHPLEHKAAGDAHVLRFNSWRLTAVARSTYFQRREQCLRNMPGPLMIEAGRDVWWPIISKDIIEFGASTTDVDYGRWIDFLRDAKIDGLVSRCLALDLLWRCHGRLSSVVSVRLLYASFQLHATESRNLRIFLAKLLRIERLSTKVLHSRITSRSCHSSPAVCRYSRSSARR